MVQRRSQLRRGMLLVNYSSLRLNQVDLTAYVMRFSKDELKNYRFLDYAELFFLQTKKSVNLGGLIQFQTGKMNEKIPENYRRKL